VNQNLFAETTLPARLHQLAERQPSREAMRFLTGSGKGTETVTYAQLWSQSACFAEVLREHVAPGARALLLLSQTLDYMRAFVGCQLAGVVAVTLFPPRSRSIGRFATIIEDCDAEIAFIERDTVEVVEEMVARYPSLARVRWLVVDEIALADDARCVPHAAAAHDVAFLQYTSGSTSAPKGVMVTHDNILRHTESFARQSGMDAGSVLVSWLPLFHDFGMIGIALQGLVLGARSVIMSPFTFTKRPLYWLEAISEYRGTHAGGPNFGFQACCDAAAAAAPGPLDLSSWTCAWNGAEPVRTATMLAFAERFAPYGFARQTLAPGYGLAETTLCVSTKQRSPDGFLVVHIDGKQASRRQVELVAPDHEAAHEMVGCGVPEMDVQIVDERTGVVAPAGGIGEIWVRGPIVAQGYWNKPEDTERVFGARIEGRPNERYLRTGDLGFVHRGELFIAGRIKDIIIVRGENIYPQDVELTVETSHPGLRPGGSAAFVAADGDDALVVVQEVRRGADATLDVAALCAAIRAQVIDDHGVDLAEVVLIRQGSIPKTSSGKIQRGATRTAHLEGTLQVIARVSFRGTEQRPAVTGGAA
jgi:acyl-CoA synthetase (AMP-forming)/AMP-acid ligase II